MFNIRLSFELIRDRILISLAVHRKKLEKY